MRVGLLIHSAVQLVACASPGGPKRGVTMCEVGVIEDGALAITDGHIVAVGPSDDLRFALYAPLMRLANWSASASSSRTHI